MNKILLFLCLLCVAQIDWSQSFAPAPGQPGSTAIHKDSSVFVAWANTCTVTRGFLQIDQPEFGFVSFGIDNNGIGVAEGNSIDIVSLGDAGSAILTFNPPIKNGSGPDFAVFENGFADNYMELAFVEVSSNGVDYFRFPAYSETPLTPQLTNGTFGNCAYVHNLAGKYRQGYGTPFDLQDLDSIGNLNLNSITHVKLIDVVGIVDSTYGTMDCLGRWINDPWPTNFESGGFDLDGIGVIHQGELKISEQSLTCSISPNPSADIFQIKASNPVDIWLSDSQGEILFETSEINSFQINMENYKAGMYFLRIKQDHKTSIEKLIKL